MKSQLQIDRPWLRLPLAPETRVLSWAINRPGLVRAPAISWREVRNKDLTPELDVAAWLESELAAEGRQHDVTFLTSRDVRKVHQSVVHVGAARVRAVATVGLSNAEVIGTRVDRTGQVWDIHDAPSWGTINVALVTNATLTDAAMIEALAITAQARTVAVMDAGHYISTGLATGTGTDCIAVAAQEGDMAYAGMHTDLGEAIGRAVREAVGKGAAEWMATYDR